MLNSNFMVTKLFVDTWGWLTLHNRRENQHAAVVEHYQKIRGTGGQLYTTDYVLDENYLSTPWITTLEKACAEFLHNLASKD